MEEGEGSPCERNSGRGGREEKRDWRRYTEGDRRVMEEGEGHGTAGK